MKNTTGELLTKQIFKDKFDIDCIGIPREKDKKTADYFLKADRKTIAVCEVEDIELQRPLVEKGDIVDKEGGFESLRNNNDVERIGKKIQRSFPQLENYNEPKVLVIVDFDNISKPFYLLNATITGMGGTRLIVSETKNGIDIYADSCHVSEGKIKNIKKKIDLYGWLNVRENTIKFRCLSNNIIGQNLMELIDNRRKS